MKLLAFALCALVFFTLASTKVQAKPVVCMGCDFARADLQGRDFRNVTYTGADFAGADLRKADFSGARLVGANFRDADLRGTNLSNVDCTGCAFRGAKLGGARTANIKLTGADLRGALDGMSDEDLRAVLNHCTGCDLQGTNLSHKDLSGIEVVGANMAGVSASGSRFRGARLVGVSFRRAGLQNADFTGAALCWHNTVHDNGITTDRETDCADFSDADVRGAVMTGARLCDDSQGAWSCSNVDAATLRRYSRSSLEGAILP